MKITVQFDPTCEVNRVTELETTLTPSFVTEKSTAGLLTLTVVNENGVLLDTFRLQVSGATGKLLRGSPAAVKPKADGITTQGE